MPTIAALTGLLLTAPLVATAEPPEHTYSWVDPLALLAVEPDRRSARMLEVLDRVPDCIQERMNLVGAHLIVMGATPPEDHPLYRRVSRDFMARGWRLLAAPFVRVQGRAYLPEQVAFVRRGARGTFGRSRLFTRWIPLTGRGERTVLHEYGHLLAFALRLASESEFHAVWAQSSPDPITDALSPRPERAKEQEWFARAFAAFYESDAERARLPTATRDYLSRLESEIHRGARDAHLLELARISSDNRFLGAAREVGERLLPAGLAGELRRRGAWGLGFYGQLWYAVQSAEQSALRGSVYELLSARRQRLVDSGAVDRLELIHLRESCAELARAPLCQAVRRHRRRLELWHPCLGEPIRGCLISYGPTRELLALEIGDDAPAFPWLDAERHRDLALGRRSRRVVVTTANALPYPQPRGLCRGFAGSTDP